MQAHDSRQWSGDAPFLDQARSSAGARDHMDQAKSSGKRNTASSNGRGAVQRFGGVESTVKMREVDAIARGLPLERCAQCFGLAAISKSACPARCLPQTQRSATRLKVDEAVAQVIR